MSADSTSGSSIFSPASFTIGPVGMSPEVLGRLFGGPAEPAPELPVEAWRERINHLVDTYRRGPALTDELVKLVEGAVLNAHAAEADKRRDLTRRVEEARRVLATA